MSETYPMPCLGCNQLIHTAEELDDHLVCLCDVESSRLLAVARNLRRQADHIEKTARRLEKYDWEPLQLVIDAKDDEAEGGDGE